MTDDTINLDRYFRAGSAARRVAEALLTGEPMTRQELAARAGGVAVTSINRVVEVLEEAGATINRDVAEDGRQARFQVVRMGKAKAKEQFPTLQSDAVVVRAELIGDNVMVDFTAGKSRYRGVLATLSKTPPMGMKSTVIGVQLMGEDRADVLLSTKAGKPLHLAHVQNVTN